MAPQNRPAVEDPVVARIRLGLVLRGLRENADRTAAEAGVHLGCSPARMSLVENGKQGIPAPEVAILLEFYGADDDSAAEAMRLAAIPWPRRRRGSRASYPETIPHAVRRYLALEAEATEIVAYDNAVVSDLLQTSAYARVLLEADAPYAGSQEIDAKLDIRMNRQARLLREDPSLALDVILDEACLHRRIGSPEIMRAQLEHLVEVSERGTIRLQLRPFIPEVTPHHDEAFAPQAFRILKFPERGSLVHLEDFTGGTYREDGPVVQEYATAYERLRRVSLEPEDTLDCLVDLVEQSG